jgi:beta-mannanase
MKRSGAWPQNFRLGVYGATNANLWISLTEATVESNTFNWYPNPGSSLTAWLSAVSGRNRIPLLTLYPTATSTAGNATLLSDILAGVYDSVMTQIVNAVNAASFSQNLLWIRWAPRMDVVDGTRIWAVPPAQAGQYGEAFSYVVRYLKPKITVPSQFVWSPLADFSVCQQYYPSDGALHVDLVGCTCLEWTRFDQDYYLGAPKVKGLYHRNNATLSTFEDLMNVKYANLTFASKPIILAKFGISCTGALGAGTGSFGSAGYQRKWMFDAFSALQENKFPLITGLVYFNAVDSDSWQPYEQDIPDFTVSSAVFSDWIGGS